MESVKVPGAKLPPLGQATKLVVAGHEVALFNIGGMPHAIGAKCTHVGGPLDQGKLDGTHVTCPWHGSQFDVRSGAVVRGPASRPVKSYRVRVEPDGLVVEFD